MRSQSHGRPYFGGLLTFAALLTFSLQASAQSPAYATVMLLNLSFFEQYTWQESVLGALLALQLILIVFLLVERARRQTATRELMASESRYRQMFEQNRTIELLIDRESGQIVEANAAAVEFYGRSLQELKQMNISDINELTANQRNEEIGRAANEGRGYVNFQHRLASGELRDVEVHISYLESDGRRLYYSIIHDVTDRKRAESRLGLLQSIGLEVAAATDLNSALEVVLRRVAENTGWAFGQAWTPSQNGTVLRPARAWAAEPDLVSFGELSHAFTFEPGVGLPGRVWASKEPVWVQNVTIDDNFPRAAIAEQSKLRAALAVPILSGDEVIAVLEFFLREPRAEDERLVKVVAAVAAQLGLVIERKRAADALNLLNIELEQRVADRTAALAAKSRELETFTYSVAHDLKAPLRGIDGYTRLLLEDHLESLNDEARSFLRNIHTSSEEMTRLIEDLLAYSRLERRDVKTERIELTPLITSLVGQKQRDTGGRGIDFALTVNGGAVIADARGLTQALRNYLDNAIKFTRDIPHPRVEVGAESVERACRMWVRDNGVGFDMKYHDRIFEIFQRLHSEEDYAGTGIGLAIVRKAMERIGGRAWAESEPGKGATFYLEIPNR